ncbi:DUF7509 family protein [Halomicrobium urmianum]|uniref:DUF7509 family protein n=1 Tax=Halomicrobium urmianum TaxID=1586233 RepID=UPI001CDA42AF|nr:hypothetical protein [Halomicrobium urmianum]
MRDRLIETLPPVRYRRFLIYLMGPYKAFDVEDVVPEGAAEDTPFLDGTPDEAGETEDVQALLERTRDRLREEIGVNAFLAIDADIPLDEMDAATQSIEFARASNVVALVAPQIGKNLGVGIETGSVLEGIDGQRQERVVFVHETGVRSAMIDSLARRWDATVATYDDEDELVDRLRTFVAQIMNAEHTGELERLDD